MLLMIDNYDSFTYNLVHYLEDLGVEVLVRRNDCLGLADIERLAPDYLVISPGPGRPADAGICVQAVREFSGKIPILGVCLGHQCIAEAFGGRVIRAHRVMHGKTCPVQHNNTGVFRGLANPLTVTRYHSLVVEPQSLPESFEETGWSFAADGQRDLMGFKHSRLPLEGVQFHPESIKTEQGHQLLQNFLQQPAQQ
ncbi:aminodeoxychorismate/anthranilate synthase component II [Gilvimarinus sp. DA14]|uniref:anthranilate synthase component II n=1 Tax=Gilvimarinus sp. DA14 TaxID=2956798 RepID=UPI0020B86574|nr:aminodeoxychorismate/anthranilate synthase component II [Gilvimarinus sp. DA14]UTF59847.1 aminodeoxychorismate/anthranilate synthase component II [Gilvimarinus sp. DA14]